jgi:putative MFS transporter
MSLAAPIGCWLGSHLADRVGRRMTIVGASLSTILFGLIYPMLSEPVLFVGIGFCLLLSIYVLVALLYGVYTPELFPTDVRLRANGICNMLGRGATIVSPFIVVNLFKTYGVSGVTTLMVMLLTIQIVAVLAWGIEPARRGLEEMDCWRNGGGLRRHSGRSAQRADPESQDNRMGQPTEMALNVCSAEPNTQDFIVVFLTGA